MWGTCALCFELINGVTKGFEERLESTESAIAPRYRENP